MVAAAIFVMEMDEVFVARIACGGQTLASCAKMSNFSLGISGTASMTKSTDDRSSMEVPAVSSDLALSACSWVILDLDTSLARSLSAQVNNDQ